MTEPERLQPEPGPDAGLDEIQTDIDQTRQQLGETVEALSAKLDVKAQARQTVDDTKARVVGTAQSARQKAGQAGPGGARSGVPGDRRCGGHHHLATSTVTRGGADLRARLGAGSAGSGH